MNDPRAIDVRAPGPLASRIPVPAAVLVAVLVAVFAGAGCAAQRELQRPLSPAAVQELDQAVSRQGADVDFVAPPGYPSPFGHVRGNARVVANGLSLKVQSRERSGEIPMDKILRVDVDRSAPALVFGLLIGAVAGLAVGAILEPTRTNCMGADHCVDLDFGGITTVAGGILGVLVGGVTGAAIGRGTTFTFSNPGPVNQTR